MGKEAIDEYVNGTSCQQNFQYGHGKNLNDNLKEIKIHPSLKGRDWEGLPFLRSLYTRNYNCQCNACSYIISFNNIALNKWKNIITKYILWKNKEKLFWKKWNEKKERRNEMKML